MIKKSKNIALILILACTYALSFVGSSKGLMPELDLRTDYVSRELNKLSSWAWHDLYSGEDAKEVYKIAYTLRLIEIENEDKTTALTKLRERVFSFLDDNKKVILNLSGKDLYEEDFPNDFFAGMENVVQINLSHNNLTHIPEGIAWLNLVDVVDLSHNKITVISEEFLGMHGQLKQLYLDNNNNELTSIPVELIRSKNIEVLSL